MPLPTQACLPPLGPWQPLLRRESPEAGKPHTLPSIVAAVVDRRFLSKGGGFPNHKKLTFLPFEKKKKVAWWCKTGKSSRCH